MVRYPVSSRPYGRTLAMLLTTTLFASIPGTIFPLHKRSRAYGLRVKWGMYMYTFCLCWL